MIIQIGLSQIGNSYTDSDLSKKIFEETDFKNGHGGDRTLLGLP
jgi:hypothetical protein